MPSLPLRRIVISNFRRLADTLDLPLDASIVLIHGANGTGKSSILSAIELALTGQIASLERIDPRYMAHLPLFGTTFATTEITIEDSTGQVRTGDRMTVGPSGLKGSPAFNAAERQFFSERCYLDQASLGRLLELYQHSDSSRESSLARFVNELLGLDELDALISGLVAVTDIRLMKRLVTEYSEATARVDRLHDELTSKATARQQIDDKLARTLSELTPLLDELGLGEFGKQLNGDRTLARDALGKLIAIDRVETLRRAVQDLAELKGRLEGAATQSPQRSLDDCRAKHSDATSQLRTWMATHGPMLHDLLTAAQEVGVGHALPRENTLSHFSELRSELIAEEASIATRLAELSASRERLARVQTDLLAARERAAAVTIELSEGEQKAGALASALAAVRSELKDDVCPICDRDFLEVGRGHLLTHLDEKIAEITSAGVSLSAIRQEANQLGTRIADLSQQQRTLAFEAEADTDLTNLESQLHELQTVNNRVEEAWPAILDGSELAVVANRTEAALADLEAQATEDQSVILRLEAIQQDMGVADSGSTGTTRERVAALLNVVAELQARTSTQNAKAARAIALLRDLDEQNLDLDRLKSLITESTMLQFEVKSRVAKADTLREGARRLRSTASETRAAIVERVFNDSLNGMWRDVFVRLAPNEPFVPAFGSPEAGKHVLNISMETIHRTGGTAGAPGAMLSAGNLNTAALSLFLALHLVVEPRIPCLVLDDPIQAMDEVHVAQFAALLRLLSKQHGRQVVIAVHQRELFDYLALELSPAFAGDELITIELPSATDGESSASLRRMTWKQDVAIAG